MDAMADAAEMLWVVLANVSGGDWTKQSADWQEAAARWRDKYFEAVRIAAAPPAPRPPQQEKSGMDVEATVAAIELLQHVKHPPIDVRGVIVIHPRPMNPVALRFIDGAIYHLTNSLQNYLRSDK